MNSIETFLEFYPEWRPILDPNGYHIDSSEEESTSISLMEQKLADASKELIKSLTDNHSTLSKFAAPSISAKEFSNFKLSKEAR